jgi:hypothetical protein
MTPAVAVMGAPHAAEVVVKRLDSVGVTAAHLAALQLGGTPTPPVVLLLSASREKLGALVESACARHGSRLVVIDGDENAATLASRVDAAIAPEPNPVVPTPGSDRALLDAAGLWKRAVAVRSDPAKWAQVLRAVLADPSASRSALSGRLGLPESGGARVTTACRAASGVRVGYGPAVTAITTIDEARFAPLARLAGIEGTPWRDHPRVRVTTGWRAVVPREDGAAGNTPVAVPASAAVPAVVDPLLAAVATLRVLMRERGYTRLSVPADGPVAYERVVVTTGTLEGA